MISSTSGAITNESRLSLGAWLVVLLLFFVSALNYLDRTMITTMRGSIVDEMPMTDAQFGLLTSVFLWVYGLLSPFAGFLADRFNRSRVIIVSLFTWSAVTWLTAYSANFGQLLTTRVLLGICQACYIPAALALIVDYHRGSTRSLASGIHIAGAMFGSSLGFLGGWIAEKYNWNSAFVIFGTAGILYSVILILFLRDAPKGISEMISEKTGNKVNFFEAIKDLFKSGSFILLLAFWGLLGVVGWMVIGWLPVYYKEHFNLSQGMAGLYATGYLYPASIAGLLLGGFLSDLWSRTNPRGRILVSVIGLCIAAPCIFMATITSILSFTIILFIVFALTRMFSNANMMPILCMIADPRYRATGFGVLNLLSTIVGGVGLYAGGVMRDFNIDLSKMFQFSAFTMVICAVLLFMIKPQSKVSE